MKPTILVTMGLPPANMERLKASSNMIYFDNVDAPLPRERLLSGIARADAAVTMLGDRIDSEVLTAGSSLKVVANFAVGINNIDLESAKAQRIAITNTPGVLTDATADLAFSLILSTARRVVEADRFVRTGAWKGWAATQFLGSSLKHKELGLVGFGRIGQAIAVRAAGFGMKVSYTARTRRDADVEARTGGHFKPFDLLIADADYVVIAAPLNESTRALFSKKSFSRMKKSAFLINVGRGEIVVEADLIGALREKQIAGAGLDVYEYEPRISGDLLAMPNTVLLPHIGSADTETREAMGNLAIDSIEAILGGREAPNRVV